MTRVQGWMASVMALALGAVLVAAAGVQAAEGPRRGFRMGGRSSLLGLLRMEQVQKELKLNEEQTAKVRQMVEKLGTEMRDQFAALRQVEDREQRRTKMAELSDQLDQKARQQLRDVLEREQVRRLYQIRMQVRPAVESLANKFLANRLKLTEEQQQKVAQITKDMQAKQSELFGAMRGASADQRGQVREKLAKIRSDADEKALAVLSAEQKEAFGKMKGEKFELQMRRGRP
jgi:Spy/CpxP family protein refolding chaperone